MNDNDNKRQGQLQLELPQDVAQGEYANFAIITHSSSDFVLDFARVLPGVPKRLLSALQENILRYERAFGPIRIPDSKGNAIAPFDINKGQA